MGETSKPDKQQVQARLGSVRTMSLLSGKRLDQLFIVQLGSILGAWGLWYVNPSWVWVLALALAPIVAGLAAEPRLPRPTPLAGPMIVFIATAFLGIWAAYDRDGAHAVFAAPSGWQKLWGLLLGALLFYTLVQTGSRSNMRYALVLFTGLGALVAVWFMWTNDWSAQRDEWSSITDVGIAIQSILPRVQGHRLNPNVAGGIIAPLLPLSFGLIRRRSARPEQQTWAIWGAITAILMAAGLILTLSRGGLLAVGCSMALWGAWTLTRRWTEPHKHIVVTVALASCSALALIALLLASPSTRGSLSRSDQVRNRLAIYSEALLLMRDFPFTGSGLGDFSLVHSTYALMIHVPILPHAHSFPLDAALEQGVLGSVAGLAILAIAGWVGLSSLARSPESQGSASREILGPALLSLSALVVHSLVDDPLYSSRGLVLLWLPAGIVLGTVRAGRKETARATPESPLRGHGALLIAGLLCLISLATQGSNMVAAWYANMGAVAQAKAELPQYDYTEFSDPTLDGIRQRTDFASAESYYQRALALNPSQPTAGARLSAIAFSRGDYEQALARAEPASLTRGDNSSRERADRVSRLVLGDALVAFGQLERAVGIIGGLARAKDRLEFQAWYKYWITEDFERAIYAWRAVLMLDPLDKDSAHWIAEAEKRIRQQ